MHCLCFWSAYLYLWVRCQESDAQPQSHIIAHSSRLGRDKVINHYSFFWELPGEESGYSRKQVAVHLTTIRFQPGCRWILVSTNSTMLNLMTRSVHELLRVSTFIRYFSMFLHFSFSLLLHYLLLCDLFLASLFQTCTRVHDITALLGTHFLNCHKCLSIFELGLRTA